MNVNREMLAFLRKQYPVGTRIRLDSMQDPYAPVEAGTTGKLDYIDDAGQFHMKWDNGRTLALIPGVDSFTVLPPELSMTKLYMPLTAELYEPDVYGNMQEEPELLTGHDLAAYEDNIRSTLVKYRMPEEVNRGIMHWYDAADSVNDKVRSVTFDVERRNGKLWGMMVWSAEPKKGYLTREGIAVMRSKMTNAIFHEEMKELYIKKDAAYKESVQIARDALLTRITAMEHSDCADPVIEQKLRELSQALEQVDGRHVYGYLPKEIKAQVDEIVERLAQIPEVAACYDQWWRLKDEIAGYYGRNTPPHQPLVQQKEFRAIKNMIIQQAETFRQPVPEQAPVKAEPNEQQVPPSPESAVAMPQPQAVTSQIKIEGGAVIQLLYHMSRVFRGNMPVIPPALRIDSKRRRRLQEKRMAMGHKRDDHEDEQLHHVNDNAMQ